MFGPSQLGGASRRQEWVGTNMQASEGRVTMQRIVRLCVGLCLFVLAWPVACARSDLGAPGSDFAETCGDAVCQPHEAGWCPSDCEHQDCGDGRCTTPETAQSCPDDCSGGSCGDGTCGPGEDPDCLADCSPCGDNFCSVAEVEGSCPLDCSDSCGNGS